MTTLKQEQERARGQYQISVEKGKISYLHIDTLVAQAYKAGMMEEAEHTEQYIKEAREDERERIIKVAGDYMNEVDHHNFVKNL